MACAFQHSTVRAIILAGCGSPRALAATPTHANPPVAAVNVNFNALVHKIEPYNSSGYMPEYFRCGEQTDPSRPVGSCTSTNRFQNVLAEDTSFCPGDLGLRTPRGSVNDPFGDDIDWAYAYFYEDLNFTEATAPEIIGVRGVAVLSCAWLHYLPAVPFQTTLQSTVRSGKPTACMKAACTASAAHLARPLHPRAALACNMLHRSQ